MKSGFSYRGKHSSEFGIAVKSKSRPMIPEQKMYTYDLPGMDGEYDMTECNEYKRPMYKSRLFELDLQITADNLSELKRQASGIGSWLTGSGDLIFDDDSGVVWKARVSSNVSFAPENRGKTAVMSVVFMVNMGSAVFNTAEGIILDNAIALDSDIPFNMTDYFTKQLNYGSNFVNIINIGDFYVKPTLIFDGGAENITITYGNKKIMLEDLSTEVIFDNERCIVTNSLGENLAYKMSGDFFELIPGMSEIEIYVDTACGMTVKYVPKTMFDFDFSNIDWGNDNA